VPSLVAAVTSEERPEPMLPRPFRVLSNRRETPDTTTLAFASEDRVALGFNPGQFTMLYVFGVGEVPISISGDPNDPTILTHTVRSVGAVTDAIVGLEIGDLVGVRGPYGVGWPMATAEGRDLLVVAGGIGLAPLRPVLIDVLANRDRYNEVSLLYGSRSPTDLLFREDLHAWRARFDLNVEVTVDRSGEGWFGDVGVVTGLLPRVSFDPASTTAMVCGPEVMMKVVGSELENRGVETGSIHVSIERNMKCAIGFCGHCQFGPDFICWGGPVLSYDRVIERLRVSEL